MSVHINIRIPDELAEAIDALGKSRSQAIIEALGAYLKQPAVIQVSPMSPEVVAEFQKAMDAQPQGKVKLLKGHQRGGKTFGVEVAMNVPKFKAKIDRTLKRGIKKALKATAEDVQSLIAPKLGKLPKNLKIEPKRTLVRTPKKVFGPSPIEAILPDLAIAAGVWQGAPRLAHAPGCKCLMCKGK